MNTRWSKSAIIYLLIFVAIIAIFFTLFSQPLGGSREISISEVISMASRGNVDTIEIQGDKLTVFSRDRLELDLVHERRNDSQF